jgi:hypothetical protein
VILPEIFGDELQVVQSGFPGLYRLPFWDGPPNPAAKHDTSTWGQWIWIDLNEPGAGTGNGGVDTTGNTPTPDNTYGLGRFIHFRTDDDVVRILVAMHVTTKETTRWTWATFWWSANPDIPQLPSSMSVANDRPAQLMGAARNYAMCTAYQMVTPGQPDTGGTNVGVSPVLCYNPWLESGFGSSVLAPVNELIPNPNYGVQTNCMSCHAMARYPHGGFIEFYSADQYIDIGPSLSDALRVDFTWSIPVNASVPDDDASTTALVPTPIPTISRWGTVLMGLLILVVANICLGYRRKARGGK